MPQCDVCNSYISYRKRDDFDGRCINCFIESSKPELRLVKNVPCDGCSSEPELCNNKEGFFHNGIFWFVDKGFYCHVNINDTRIKCKLGRKG